MYEVDRKNLSFGISVRHHSASLVMPISDPRDRFFYPHHTSMIDTYNLIYHFCHLSSSLWETARYRLQYCLKGPLHPKQLTNQLWIQYNEPAVVSRRENMFNLQYYVITADNSYASHSFWIYIQFLTTDSESRLFGSVVEHWRSGFKCRQSHGIFPA